MIKVSIMYPYSDKSSFNIDYYCDKHIPMVQKYFGATCQGVSVDEGIINENTHQLPAFHAIAHFNFESIEAFQDVMAPHAEKIMEDAPNYTNVQPVIQISNIKISIK